MNKKKAILTLAIAVLACAFATSSFTAAATISSHDDVTLTVMNSGSSWETMTSNTPASLKGVWGSSSSDVFAVGTGGTILHYDGSDWSSMTSGTTESLLSVWGSSSSDVFAVGSKGTILHYDGSHWSSMTSGTAKCLHGVWGSSASDVFAGGGIVSPLESHFSTGAVIGSIYLHFDGSTWRIKRQWQKRYILGLWCSSSSEVFVVGKSSPTFTLEPVSPGSTMTRRVYTGRYEEGCILYYDGATWTDIYPLGGYRKKLEDVWGSSSSDVFAVGEKGTILHSDGSRSKKMTSGTTEMLWGVWGSSSSDVFVVGSGGTIVHYDGSDWSSMTSGTTKGLGGVWGSSASDVFAVGDWGTILHYAVNPRVTGVSIGSGDQGATLDVVITGDYFSGATVVSFGPGITVSSFTVDSPTQMTASITIAADAASGARDVSVTTPAGTATLPGAFSVEAPPEAEKEKPVPPSAEEEKVAPLPAEEEKVAPPPSEEEKTPPEPISEPTPSTTEKSPSCAFGPGDGVAGLGDLAFMLGVVLVGFAFMRFRRR